MLCLSGLSAASMICVALFIPVSQLLIRIPGGGVRTCPASHNVYTGRWERAGFCLAARCWGLCHLLIFTISISFRHTPGWSEGVSIRSSSPCLSIAGRFPFTGALFLLVREFAWCCIYAFRMISTVLFSPAV